MQNDTMDTSDEFPYDTEIVAMNLFVPWALDISQDGTLYVTERSGSIWILRNGEFLPEPLITFDRPFVSLGEGGLMGLVLDPDFEQNHFIYVMHSYAEGGMNYSRVVRLLEQEDRAAVDSVLIDRIPGGRTHLGGRIKIGPDRKLYITTGDAGNARLAQDLSSLAGKILRINLDGSIPEDNPFEASPVYSYGHRNPQGLAWNNNIMYASEHGQTAHDEINIIYPGANYGWPTVQGDVESEFTRPLLASGNTTWAPAGIAFINQGPWQGRLVVANLFATRILSLSFNEDGTLVEQVEPFLVNEYGRLRDVYQAADGSIYLTTSNRDGRGFPRPEDDKMIRLVPRS